MPENYITSQTEKGNISISEDVIQVMVNAAVSEIEGVAGLSSVPGADIAEFLGIKSARRSSISLSWFATATALPLLPRRCRIRLPRAWRT